MRPASCGWWHKTKSRTEKFRPVREAANKQGGQNDRSAAAAFLGRYRPPRFGHSEESSSASLTGSRGYELLRALVSPVTGCSCPGLLPRSRPKQNDHSAPPPSLASVLTWSVPVTRPTKCGCGQP